MYNPSFSGFSLEYSFEILITGLALRTFQRVIETVQTGFSLEYAIIKLHSDNCTYSLFELMLKFFFL